MIEKPWELLAEQPPTLEAPPSDTQPAALPLLPDFPSGPMYLNPKSLRDTYLWAKLMLDFWGEAALTAIQNQMQDAVRRNDFAAFKGWQNIGIALADLARAAGDDEAVH